MAERSKPSERSTKDRGGLERHHTEVKNSRTQAEKFEAAARELGCDEDEDRFKDVLRKLASRKSDGTE